MLSKFQPYFDDLLTRIQLYHNQKFHSKKNVYWDLRVEQTNMRIIYDIFRPKSRGLKLKYNPKIRHIQRRLVEVNPKNTPKNVKTGVKCALTQVCKFWVVSPKTLRRNAKIKILTHHCHFLITISSNNTSNQILCRLIGIYSLPRNQIRWLRIKIFPL